MVYLNKLTSPRRSEITDTCPNLVGQAVQQLSILFSGDLWASKPIVDS
jgi:hypothetical protein